MDCTLIISQEPSNTKFALTQLLYLAKFSGSSVKLWLFLSLKSQTCFQSLWHVSQKYMYICTNTSKIASDSKEIQFTISHIWACIYYLKTFQVFILYGLQFMDSDSVTRKLEIINLEVFNFGFGKITSHSCRAELTPVDWSIYRRVSIIQQLFQGLHISVECWFQKEWN